MSRDEVPICMTKKYRTMNGEDVVILSTSARTRFPVIGHIGTDTGITYWTVHGLYNMYAELYDIPHQMDLVEVREDQGREMSRDDAPNFRKIPNNESCWNCDYYSYDGGKCENHNLNLEDYEGYIWDYVCDDWKKPHTIKTIVLFTPIRNG